MFIRLFLALAVFIGLLILYSRYKKLDKKGRRDLILKTVLYTSAGLLLFAVVTGRMHWIGAVIAALLGFTKIGLNYLLRALPFLNLVRKQQGFGTPKFSTPYFTIQIDLNTGRIQGEIIDGPHSGTPLEALTDAQLVELEKHYATRDKKSYYLIRALRQRGQNNHQQNQKTYEPLATSVDEAKQILGLSGNPTKQDVIKAHKSLMQKLHPDRGGNDYLAAQINNAKDVLIKHLG